ncbi:hypothetical protein ACWCOP_06010 [Maricaulaceae bacterium MS644]
MAVFEDFDPPKNSPAARLAAGMRRGAPLLGAAALHCAGLAAVIWLAAKTPLEGPPRRVVHVELVTPAREPAAEPEVDLAEPPALAMAEPAPPRETSNLAPADAAAPRDIPVGEAVVLDAPGGAAGETAFPTRSSALRGLACVRAFGREDGQIGCDSVPAADLAAYAAGEGAARIEALTQARFNALAGLYGAQLDPALRRLPGQQGMQVMVNRRAGMSGADEMRDSLPPMVPDPAFKD